MGMGIALASMPHAVPYLDSCVLTRVLPDWYVDGGSLALYFPAQKLLPAKTLLSISSSRIFASRHWRRAVRRCFRSTRGRI
jgi:hypothetical protein